MGNIARPLHTPDLEAYRSIAPLNPLKMRSQIYKFVPKAAKALFFVSEGRVVATTATTLRGKVPLLGSVHLRGDSRNPFGGWDFGALALPAVVYMLQEQEAHAAELERTFIAIKPDGVQRGLIARIISRFNLNEMDTGLWRQLSQLFLARNLPRNVIMISRKDPSLMVSVNFSALDLYLPWFGRAKES